MADHEQSDRRLKSFVQTLIRQCICANAAGYHFNAERKGVSPETQFVELKGIRFIGLGAVTDELTPRERVYDTLEVLRTKADRLLSIGYILDNPNKKPQTIEKVVESIPYEAWTRDFIDEASMSVKVQRIVQLVKTKNFVALRRELQMDLSTTKNSLHSGVNFYAVGIVAHNLGVASVLAGSDYESIEFFKDAIQLKEIAFGKDHPQVAQSWDELGIQYFARGDFIRARESFQIAHNLRVENSNHVNPLLAMTLNNVACCDFQTGQYEQALKSLETARDIQHQAAGSTEHGELDLLHIAIVYCNCAYLNLALKRYEEAIIILEEALLIQQSVLDDDHRAVRDTLSNLEFANAFHS
jgi:Tetratricopeptide repeat